jgi:hypothetical protein
VRQSSTVYSSSWGTEYDSKETAAWASILNCVTDRRRLYVYLEMGLSIKEIAKKLSRHKSSLYRELKRNKESEGYLPIRAEEKKNARIK